MLSDATPIEDKGKRRIPPDEAGELNKELKFAPKRLLHGILEAVAYREEGKDEVTAAGGGEVGKRGGEDAGPVAHSAAAPVNELQLLNIHPAQPVKEGNGKEEKGGEEEPYKARGRRSHEGDDEDSPSMGRPPSSSEIYLESSSKMPPESYINSQRRPDPKFTSLAPNLKKYGD